MVIDRVSVGDSITVGAGSVVVAPLVEPGTDVGAPARPISKMLENSVESSAFLQDLFSRFLWRGRAIHLSTGTRQHISRHRNRRSFIEAPNVSSETHALDIDTVHRVRRNFEIASTAVSFGAFAKFASLARARRISSIIIIRGRSATWFILPPDLQNPRC